MKFFIPVGLEHQLDRLNARQFLHIETFLSFLVVVIGIYAILPPLLHGGE